MARAVLGGPGDEGRSSYQVAVNICERCGAGSQDGAGEAIPVDTSIVAMAHCDAQYVGRITRHPIQPANARGAGAPHAVASDAANDVHCAARDAGGTPRLACKQAGESGLTASGTHVGASGAHGRHIMANDATDRIRRAAREAAGMPRGTSRDTDAMHRTANRAAGKTHVGAPARATQSIPPAIRRQVMRRDHGRCVVSGCRHATFVDVHHIETRADGGVHDADNLIVMCTAHHRALHRGQLEMLGSVGEGLVFRRSDGSDGSDGSDYGALDSAHSAGVCERAFRGLRSLGFGEREARRGIERTRASGELETVLRRALSALTAPHGNGGVTTMASGSSR